MKIWKEATVVIGSTSNLYWYERKCYTLSIASRNAVNIHSTDVSERFRCIISYSTFRYLHKTWRVINFLVYTMYNVYRFYNVDLYKNVDYIHEIQNL